MSPSHASGETGPSAARPGISVVIVNLNGRHLLEPCLTSLRSELCDPAAEVIVVDNASRDGSCEWLRAAWPEVRVLELRRNEGFAGAANLGARMARAETVIFLNNDAVVAPGWSAALVAALGASTDVAIAGGLTLFEHHADVVNSAGTRIALTGAGTDIGFGLARESVDLTPRDIAGVSGVSMAVRRDWFLDAGEFDQDFFMYLEDVDLCLRAWLEGYRVRFVPDSIVLHAFGATAGSRHAAWRYYYGTRNRLLIASKAYDWPHLLLAWLLSIVQDVAAVIACMARGELMRGASSASGKLRGTIAALAALYRCRHSRRAARARQRRTVRDLREQGIIDGVAASVHEFVRRRGALDRGP